jgi:hypothetical protein
MNSRLPVTLPFCLLGLLGLALLLDTAAPARCDDCNGNQASDPQPCLASQLCTDRVAQLGADICEAYSQKDNIQDVPVCEPAPEAYYGCEASTTDCYDEHGCKWDPTTTPPSCIRGAFIRTWQTVYYDTIEC